MATRSTNTMQEALQRFLKEIAQMKTLQDADLPYLVELETMVLNRIRQPAEDMMQQATNPAPPPGMASGMMGGSPAGSPMGPGFNAGPAMPNPDELRRLLDSSAVG